ncbi:MAG TPA: hypothetical protein VNO51_15400 [Ilumatobacteraceae bacterium]|nr:hypothetical protein [Ilumatobacteraceae bacterium]
MTRLAVAVAIVVVVAVVASVVRRRRSSDPPTQGGFELPVQLDRRDFDRSDAPWLVAVFTSATCESCADVVSKAAVLAAADVAVVEVTYQERADLHARYAVEAVPALVVADADGVVRAGFLGPVTATDLWAAVAEARQ